MDRVAEAFAAVPRIDFLPASQQRFAHEDRPLPIGHGATNSQPWTVNYMLRLLDVRPGDRVLDLGSGSGWTTALLAHLAGPTGEVIGVDTVPALVDLGRAHLGQRFPWARIVRAAPGVLGWPDAAPYDRILVSADGERVPEELEAQLAAGGRMVLPAASVMMLVERLDSGAVRRTSTGDRFTFVPLR
ncbi:MAG TPA: methyltransferase domain-containing protein [Propionibacteriaceae bacterium]|nr:methyltransferase domain-containing protein [Propionibacteriaceae bacterium]